MDFEEFKEQRENILNDRASGIPDRLKKIKVLARAIYTEVASHLLLEGTFRRVNMEEVSGDCIKAAMKFEEAFSTFEREVRDENENK